LCAASSALTLPSSLVLLKGLGIMEETTSAGSGISRAAKGLAEL